jgi:hypothetical protein
VTSYENLDLNIAAQCPNSSRSPDFMALAGAEYEPWQLCRIAERAATRPAEADLGSRRCH